MKRAEHDARFGSETKLWQTVRLQILKDKKIYVCRKCQAHIARSKDIIKTKKQYWVGSEIASCFEKAINYTQGARTGKRGARFIHCKGCETKIGWKRANTDEVVLSGTDLEKGPKWN